MKAKKVAFGTASLSDRARPCLTCLGIHACIKAILSAVGFVCDYDNVMPVRQSRVTVLTLFKPKLLNSCEDDTARRTVGQKFAQLSSTIGLLGAFAQQIASARKTPKSWPSRSCRSVTISMVGLQAAAHPSNDLLGTPSRCFYLLLRMPTTPPFLLPSVALA